MTKTVTIKPHQTQLDLAVQEYGTMEALFSLLEANDESVTSVLGVGKKLVTPEAETDSDVLTYYKANTIEVATAFDQTVTGSIQGIIYTTPPPKIDETECLKNQTLLDIAIQETGNIDSLIELCEANDVSITNAIVPGTKLKTNSTIINDEVLAYYIRKNLKPASDLKITVEGGYAISTYVEINYWL